MTILGLLIFFINFLLTSRNSSFISPIGKNNTDRNKVEKILKDNDILFSQVFILSDLSYGVNISNNGQVRLSSQKDIIQQITSLQRILRELTIEGKPFKNIDFRFEEPIISF
jgi:hypothetical protein